MTTRIFGAPHLYIQGPDALERLPDLLSGLGARAFLVVDPFVAQRYGPRLTELLGPSAAIAAFGGECTSAEIDRMSEIAESHNADVIVGMGGGKAIDTAKGVRIKRGGRIVIVPTIASNDSPTSRLSVIYKEDHALSEVRLMSTNPDVVLVDSKLIVEAPVRFFLAGIGDALSKKYEATECVNADARNFYGGAQTECLRAIASHCDKILRRDAVAAANDVRTHRISPEVESVIEAAVLLSGLAFENGGLSIAHSLTRGFSVIPAMQSYLHREQVAFGTLVQLAMTPDAEAERDDFARLLANLSLPRRLSDFGGTDQDAQTIAEVTFDTSPYIRNFQRPVTVAFIVRAIRSLETD
ncbi:MAG: glycerol dehydrogenase [Hoeflea sp.]|uniref:glycerol dehydrogenase n=1 Tax=Hoeflea sp. TaxID=1940281 RepID=UPI001D48CF6B|nr:glycerol dehydrogenase [Hoeflea sp.]MBU4531369.1 glycerol dehydrogenase [Alphaproteobacteria bacterium]MBU4544226.1 glycerol dehydrogenase [Alphaproteobacteria bacterium]MBU4550537.1 glycerol dehydrogenase [Alphaproteobacteria bacterium]MBV1724645.1 glycerol dehydrogenase [Hoeflea sp.]MBV1760665.1 glycerol dehydrogenase [Hoeflea sp.]